MVRELEGALPSDVRLELIYAPTFHAHVGIRVTKTQLEWWQHDFVTSADLTTEVAIPELASSRGSNRGGRDGMTILVRTPHFETRRSTADDDSSDPWLEFARQFLATLAVHFPNPLQQQALSDLGTYLN